MKRNNFKKFIIVDSDNRPMAFGKGQEQLVYCNRRKADRRLSNSPVIVYTEKQANEAISKTIDFRKSYGYDIDNYYLMPVA